MSALSVTVARHIRRKWQEITEHILKRKAEQKEVVEVQNDEVLLGGLRKNIPSKDPFDNNVTYYKAIKVKSDYVKYIFGEDKNNMKCSGSCEINTYLRMSKEV